MAKKNQPLDFTKIFNDYIKSIKKVWGHDRSKTVGASEVFGCLRQNFFNKHGYKPDPEYKDRWGAMQRGNLIEDHHVVPAMEFLPKEYELLGGGEHQETFIKHLLSATPDGLIINLPKNALKKYGVKDIESDCIVFEIKSIDPRVNLKEEKAIHRGQVHTQMGLIREMSDFKPMYAIILYLDASFLDDVEYFVVKFDPKIYNIAHKRANIVFGAKKPMDVAAEGLITGACEYCPFVKQCMATIKGAIPDDNSDEVDEEAKKEMAKLITHASKMGNIKKEAEKAHKQANEDVKEFLRHSDTRRILGDTWSVTYSGVKGRTTYDFKLMQADGFNLSKYEKIGAGYDKLTITFKK